MNDPYLLELIPGTTGYLAWSNFVDCWVARCLGQAMTGHAEERLYDYMLSKYNGYNFRSLSKPGIIEFDTKEDAIAFILKFS